MIDEDCLLSVDQMRVLLDKIKARPLESKAVKQHYQAVLDGAMHPISGPLFRWMEEYAPDGEGPSQPTPDGWQDYEQWLALMRKRRDGLIAFLERAIALGEPIGCSV